MCETMPAALAAAATQADKIGVRIGEFLHKYVQPHKYAEAKEEILGIVDDISQDHIAIMRGTFEEVFGGKP